MGSRNEILGKGASRSEFFPKAGIESGISGWVSHPDSDFTVKWSERTNRIRGT